jgi:hypothetical protein
MQLGGTERREVDTIGGVWGAAGFEPCFQVRLARHILKHQFLERILPLAARARRFPLLDMIE